jgi:uncharacterized protein YggE
MRKSVLMFVVLFSTMMNAQDQKVITPQISVTGEGKIKVIPDRATINVGIINNGKDSKEVKNLNDQTSDKVIKFLKKFGSSVIDYKTDNVSLYKNYDYEKKKYNFQASQNISITLKDLSKYDELMMGLNDTGINSINGVEFKSSKMEEHQREARKKAMLNAKQKAEDFVSVLNQKVGKAILISDSSQAYYPQPVYKNAVMAMAESADATSRETIAIGEIEITSTVNVSFILD